MSSASATERRSSNNSAVPVENFKKPALSTQTTADGLKIEIIKKGSGAAVKSGDTVDIDYIGELTDGTVFDSSYSRGQAFETQIGTGHVPDSVYLEARSQFSEQELVRLTTAVVAINGWNRLCIAFRVPAGTYEPPKRPS